METTYYTNYYTISYDQSADFVSILWITIGCYVAMSIGILLVREKRAVKNLLFLAISLIAAIISSVVAWHSYSITNAAIDSYLNKNYEILEGLVEIKHLQPKTGHAPGDIILIDGREIEINYFCITPGYNKTVAHGGVLREGVYARIFISKNTILRIDIKAK